MVDLIVIVVLAVIIGAAVVYIRKEKKNGVKCIGCPEGANCGKNNGESGCGGCGGENGGCSGCHAKAN